MNILHVTLGFYPSLAWGGPIKIVHQNCKELVRRGHNVTICCTNLLDKKNKIRKTTFQDEIDGIKIVYLNSWNISWWPGTLGPIWLPQLNSFLKREMINFDIVHLNGYRSTMMLVSANCARQYGVPIVTQPMGTLPIIISSLFGKKIYDMIVGRLELRGIEALIALQELERQQAMAHGVPENRIVVIPNGIDPTNKMLPPGPGLFRRRFGLDKKPLVLFLARINKVKGADMLLEAFYQLGDVEAQLAIVGPDDGHLSEIISLIEKFKLKSRVTITGPITESEKVAAYYDADLFVLPSRYDAYPTTVMEACLYGKPMVITDRCESAHLLKNRVAEVVPFESISFASAIRRLLTNSDLYESYRSNCQIVLEDTFSIKSVIDRIEAIYERAMLRRRK